MGASIADKGGIGFKRAVLVYFTARTYEIHRIQRLTIENVEHVGMSMVTLERVIDCERLQ